MFLFAQSRISNYKITKRAKCSSFDSGHICGWSFAATGGRLEQWATSNGRWVLSENSEKVCPEFPRLSKCHAQVTGHYECLDHSKHFQSDKHLESWPAAQTLNSQVWTANFEVQTWEKCILIKKLQHWQWRLLWSHFIVRAVPVKFNCANESHSVSTRVCQVVRSWWTIGWPGRHPGRLAGERVQAPVQ